MGEIPHFRPEAVPQIIDGFPGRPFIEPFRALAFDIAVTSENRGREARVYQTLDISPDKLNGVTYAIWTSDGKDKRFGTCSVASDETSVLVGFGSQFSKINSRVRDVEREKERMFNYVSGNLRDSFGWWFMSGVRDEQRLVSLEALDLNQEIVNESDGKLSVVTRLH